MLIEHSMEGRIFRNKYTGFLNSVEVFNKYPVYFVPLVLHITFVCCYTGYYEGHKEGSDIASV